MPGKKQNLNSLRRRRKFWTKFKCKTESECHRRKFWTFWVRIQGFSVPKCTLVL